MQTKTQNTTPLNVTRYKTYRAQTNITNHENKKPWKNKNRQIKSK